MAEIKLTLLSHQNREKRRTPSYHINERGDVPDRSYQMREVISFTQDREFYHTHGWSYVPCFMTKCVGGGTRNIRF